MTISIQIIQIGVSILCLVNHTVCIMNYDRIIKYKIYCNILYYIILPTAVAVMSANSNGTKIMINVEHMAKCSSILKIKTKVYNITTLYNTMIL